MCARKQSSTTSPRTSTIRNRLLRNTLPKIPPQLPTCRLRIRSARNGILAKVAFPRFDNPGFYIPVAGKDGRPRPCPPRGGVDPLEETGFVHRSSLKSEKSVSERPRATINVREGT